MNEYAIHELILEDIERNSPALMPARVTFPERTNGIPPGTYEPNADGIWVRMEADPTAEPRCDNCPRPGFHHGDLCWVLDSLKESDDEQGLPARDPHVR